MSECFSQWAAADTVIPKLVDRFFGPCLSAQGSDVNISLVRPEIIQEVPLEYRDMFEGLIGEFHRFALGALDLNGLLNRYEGEPINEWTFWYMGRDISCMIASYERDHESLKSVLTRTLLTGRLWTW